MFRIISYEDKYKDETIKLILPILEDEFDFDGIDRPDLWNIPEVYQQEKSDFWLAVVNDKVVGTIALKNYGDGRGYLKRMYVDQSMRRQGLGQKLFNHLVEFAKHHSFRKIYVGTEEEFAGALQFYQKNGFEIIKKLPDDLPDFDDHIFLRLDL